MVVAIVPIWGLEPGGKQIADMNIQRICDCLSNGGARFATHHIFYAARGQAVSTLKSSDAAETLAKVSLQILAMRGF